MIQRHMQKGSKIARMSAARLAAVQAVYQMKANDQSAEEVINEYKRHRLGQPVEGHSMVVPDGVLFTGIVKGIMARERDLHSIIDACMTSQGQSKYSHSLESIEPLLGSILLCGAYELLAHHDVDPPIIISDYLDVTHAFYEGGEAKLVNGVLDRVRSSVRDE